MPSHAVSVIDPDGNGPQAHAQISRTFSIPFGSPGTTWSFLISSLAKWNSCSDPWDATISLRLLLGYSHVGFWTVTKQGLQADALSRGYLLFLPARWQESFLPLHNCGEFRPDSPLMHNACLAARACQKHSLFSVLAEAPLQTSLEQYGMKLQENRCTWAPIFFWYAWKGKTRVKIQQIKP